MACVIYNGSIKRYIPLKLLMNELKEWIDLYDHSPISCQVELYQDLGWIIQNLDKLEQVRNLKTRFQDVLEEIQDMIDLYVGDSSDSKDGTDLFSKHSVSFAMFLILKSPLIIRDILRLIKSIKEDYLSILNNMNIIETSPTPRTDGLKTQYAATSVTSSINSQVWDEIVVGLDRDLDLIRSKLAEDTKKLEIVSVVGMGGSGKTTLATYVFNDSYVCYHFNIRGWVTVSQTYEKTDLLNQILASIGVKIDHEKRDKCSYLCEKLHKRLMRQRYLIVVDDIWNIEAWEDLKVVFPDDNNGSRIMLTSRHKHVALHAKSHGFVHQLRRLTDEESWELLLKKVFHGHDFPDWVTEPGMQIARNCRGLPLAVVVVSGILAKEPVIRDLWERISESGSSLIFKGHMETLALSVNHLPSHLRNCFLYLGGFPEDYKFQVTRLIWLWIAEGFIQESENQSLEETAEDYLMELVDRSLVVVQGRKFDGAVKTFAVHDVLRELSSEIATKERFSVKVLGWENRIIAPHKTSRLLVHVLPSSTPWSFERYINLKCSRSWKLLTVLDLKQASRGNLPEVISLLVNLRYLAFRSVDSDFQYAICHLRSLKTLIIEAIYPISDHPLVLPDTISNLVNLRHLQCQQTIKFPPLEMPLMNLQTISNVDMEHEPTNCVNYFPCVKKLSCSLGEERIFDLRSLTFLEILKIRGASSVISENKSMFWFPASLKKLTIQGCHLPWSSMSSIQSLPNLEVLKLLRGAFVGPRWDTGEEPFQQLKHLKLEGLDINQWEAFAISFPRLKHLALYNCHSLESIPPDMGYIPTLECIQIDDASNSAVNSAYKIQEEQHADGNCDLKIRVTRSSDSVFRDTMEQGESWLAKLFVVNSMWKHDNIFNIAESEIKIRTGISINLLTPQELEALGISINDPPAHNHYHICRSRNWSDGRSKYHLIKRKILKGGGRIRLFQY